MGGAGEGVRVRGGVRCEGLEDSYYGQAKGLSEGGSDLRLVETCQDTRNIKAAILAIQKLSREIGMRVPFLVSVPIEPMGSMLAGQTVEAMWASLRHGQPVAIGMNGAPGAEVMHDPSRPVSPITGGVVTD